MEELKSALLNGAEKLDISITDEQIDRFGAFARLLLEWNEKMNLTAITSPAEIAVKHFLDSISLLKFYDIPFGAKMIDVGCGAGFPSIPLLVIRPDLDMTMMDGTGKRLAFIDAALAHLGLNGKTLHKRAEEAGRDEKYREQFDFAVARAVARLNTLCEYCIPLIRKNGAFIAMKALAQEEIDESGNALSLLSASVSDVKTFNLPDGSERTLIYIKKFSHTSPKYPRASTQISKKPLK